MPLDEGGAVGVVCGLEAILVSRRGGMDGALQASRVGAWARTWCDGFVASPRKHR